MNTVADRSSTKEKISGSHVFHSAVPSEKLAVFHRLDRLRCLRPRRAAVRVRHWSCCQSTSCPYSTVIGDALSVIALFVSGSISSPYEIERHRLRKHTEKYSN